MSKMKLEVWFNKIDEIVNRAREQGKEVIDSYDIMVELGVSYNYALSLLRAYAKARNMKYVRGKLQLTEQVTQ